MLSILYNYLAEEVMDMGVQTNIAYEFIKVKILNGAFRPSQKLTESYLAEAVGVSRNTVKKALLMLEKENLIELERNKGATIKSFYLEEVINYLEIREALEALVIRNTAKYISESNLKKLEVTLQQMHNQVLENKFDKYPKLNEEFHGIIYSASKKNQAVQMINIIKIQLSRLHSKAVLIPGRFQESYDEHALIYEALKAHDENKAEEAIKNHLAKVRHVISEHYNLLL